MVVSGLCRFDVEVRVKQLWAGVDIGKEHHHCVVIDADGNHLLSRRVVNDEGILLELIRDVRCLATEVNWAIDLQDGGAMLLIALLASQYQPLFYIPGRTVNWAASIYRGDAKTDARDAAIIADQARMRRDLVPLRLTDELVTEMRILTRRREDVVHDRTRSVNRLRGQLLEYFPALERAFEFQKTKGALILLSCARTPAGLRAMGVSRLASLLKIKGARNAHRIAARAIAAAEAQHTELPGQAVAAEVVAREVRTIRALDDEVTELDRMIEQRFWQHPHAALITSLPGLGPTLSAELIVAASGDLTAFGSPDRLAGAAGLAPTPRDSGRISGNLHRPQRYSRRMMRAFYLAAMVSIQHCPESKTYYARKRSEGKRHSQAVIALARRRVNVLWAILRDGRPYHEHDPGPRTTTANTRARQRGNGELNPPAGRLVVSW